MNKYELYKLKVAGLSNLQVFNIVNYWEMNGEWPSLELIAKIAGQTGLTKKDTTKFLEAFQDVVAVELEHGGKVQLIGFGTFDVRDRAARKGRNPQTNEVIDIPASKVPAFKAGKALKDVVRG